MAYNKVWIPIASNIRITFSTQFSTKTLKIGQSMILLSGFASLIGFHEPGKMSEYWEGWFKRKQDFILKESASAL